MVHASNKSGRVTTRRQLKVALEQLRASANRQFAQRLRRVGIDAPKSLGVPVPEIRRLARELGTNHRLALALWTTKLHEARILAILIADPLRISKPEIERWLSDLDTWDLCDHLCVDFVKDMPNPLQYVSRWIRRNELFVRRAAFTLIATLAIHDKSLPNATFAQLLDLIERCASDPRNYVKKAASWAIRQIGKRNECLHVAALASAHRLRAAEGDVHKWIAADVVRELGRRGPRLPR